MEKKKILLVSATFHPFISPRSFRATELAKELARKGHEVTVYTIFENADYDQMGKDFNIRFKDLGKRKFGVLRLKGGKVVNLLNRAINRTLLQLFEFPDIELMWKVKKALAHESGYDLLITIATPFPVHWGTAWALNTKNHVSKTWIADCGDPYMGCITDSFRKVFYFKYVEQWFCRKADYITIPVESGISGYYPAFHSKIRVIPQGFEMKEIPEEEPSEKNGILQFAYAGAFIPGFRDPHPFLDYLSRVEMPFKFTVYTNTPNMLSGYDESLREKLSIRNYIPREELLRELKRNDFLVNFDNNTAMHTPSKLIDYAMVGRPILNISKEFPIRTINEFLNKNYTGQMQLGDIQQYNIEKVTEKFLALT